MLLDDIKARITQAMKAKDEVARDVLRLAASEAQKLDVQSDADVIAIVRKLVKSNEETLALSGDAPQAPTLRREIEVLTALLPQTLSVAAIVEALAPVKDALLAAKNDGQATGVAMKHMKGTGAVFEGNDVAAAVKQIRA